MLRGGLATFTGNAWAVVVGVVTLPIALRGLGAERFGLWVLLQTLSAVSGWLSLADLGLRAAVVREVAHAQGRGDPAAADRIAGTATRVYGALAVVVALVTIVIGHTLLPDWFGTPSDLHDDFRSATLWFSAQIAAELMLVAAQALIEGSQRVAVARGVHALRATAIAFGVSIAATRSGSLGTVAAVSAAVTCFSAAIAWLLAFRLTTTRPRGWSSSVARQLVRYGSQIGAINATGVLHRTMDRIVIAAIYGPAAVALVEIATQIANGVSIALSVAYPLTATASWVDGRGDRDGLRRLLVRGTKLTLLATLPATAIGTILAANVVEVWMGARWIEAGGLTTLAVAGVSLAAPSQAASLILQATGRARDVLGPAILAVGVNLVLTVWLARAFGIAGVFWATIVTASALGVPIVRHALARTQTAGGALLRAALMPTVLPALVTFGGAAIGRSVDNGLTGLCVGAGIAAIAWAGSAWRVGLDDADRDAVTEGLSLRRLARSR